MKTFSSPQCFHPIVHDGDDDIDDGDYDIDDDDDDGIETRSYE